MASAENQKLNIAVNKFRQVHFGTQASTTTKVLALPPFSKAFSDFSECPRLRAQSGFVV